MQGFDEEWYVIVRKDNGYPLQILTDKGTAQHLARVNNEKVVTVVPIGEDDDEAGDA